MKRSGALPFVLAIGLFGCSDGATADVAETVDSSTTDGAADTGESVDTGSGDETAIDSSTPPSDYMTKGTATVTKSDTTVSGNRLHVLVPSGAVPASGFPAVVFAHGFQLGEKDYDDVLGHVASWGFVVLSTDYQASLLSQDHRKVRDAIIAAKDAAIGGKITGIPKIDPKRIASAGHSLGGKCAVWAAITDSSFAGTFVLDPVDGGGPLDTTSTPERPFLVTTGELSKLTKPIGYVGATQSHCASFGQACAPEGKDATAFYGATPTSLARYWFSLYDFGHMQFLDNPSCGTCATCVAGKSDLLTRKNWIKALFVAFLSRHLDADTSAQTWLDGAKRAEGFAAKQLWDGKIDRPACP